MNMDMTGFEQSVRERAYYLWENEGRPMGRHVEHWLASEEELRAEQDAAQPGACAPEAVRCAEAIKTDAVLAASKPVRAKPKKAAAAKASPVRKTPALSAKRGALAGEMPATLQ